MESATDVTVKSRAFQLQVLIYQLLQVIDPSEPNILHEPMSLYDDPLGGTLRGGTGLSSSREAMKRDYDVRATLHKWFYGAVGLVALVSWVTFSCMPFYHLFIYRCCQCCCDYD